MPTILELREKRANVWAQAQEFNSRHAKGETMSPEDETAWSRALNEVDELGTLIDNRERTDTLDKRFAEIDERTNVLDTRGGENGSVDEYRAAFAEYIRGGTDALTVEQRQLMQRNFVAGAELRAQGVGTGAAGGYTVPQGFWAKVTETMAYYGGTLAAGAEVINTDSGNPLPWPTNDDTANEGVELAENTQIGGQDITFGQKQLGAITYTSKLMLASLQFLQDTGIDGEAFIARKAGERLGRIYNRRATTGTGGGSQPQGVITGATTGKTTASATAFTYDEIVDLIHSVDVAYRQGPGGAKFMFHDLVLAKLRKIRDDSGGAGLGRPIWEPSVQVGAPDSLLGYGTVVNNAMASAVTTGQKTMAFGNFGAAYVWRNVNGGQLMRLTERYADYLQVGFFAFGRADGLVQDASAVKLLVQA